MKRLREALGVIWDLSTASPARRADVAMIFEWRGAPVEQWIGGTGFCGSDLAEGCQPLFRGGNWWQKASSDDLQKL